MSDIIAIFGILFITSLAFPGMLAAWWLLFPKLVERARLRVEHTPWKTFAMGLAGLFLAALPIFILLSLEIGPAQFLGWAGIFGLLAFATLGAAGIAAQMGAQIAARAGNEISPAKAFVLGAVAFELAAAFPVLGWLIVAPLWIVTSLGAALFALLRWTPRPKPHTPPIPRVENTLQVES